MYKKKTLGFMAIAMIIVAFALALTLGACEEEQEQEPEPEKVATPVANPPGGAYTGAQLVALTSDTEGAVIYYTTDGSTPTSNSSLYSGTIAVSAGSTTLRAVAVKSGMDNSDILTATYNITNPDMGPLTEVRWLEILQGIEASSTFNGTLDLTGYTRSDSATGGGLRSNGTFDPVSNTLIGKSKIVSLILPNSATGIADGTSASPTFRYFTNLETFSGELLSSIGSYAFAGCTKLAISELPAWLTSIGEGAFLGCTSLAQAVVPAGITSMNSSVFSGCTGLTYVTLPAELASIGSSAFQDCPNIELVTIYRATPPTLGFNAFSAAPGLIRVPTDSVAAYREASGWSLYSDRIIAMGSIPVITITTQPASRDTAQGSSVSLSVAASVTQGMTPNYQWYSNTSNSSTGGTAINGATNASYTIPTTLTAGTYYYYCEVRAIGAVTVRSSVAAVNVYAITINTQPAATTNVARGNISGSLSVAASVTPSTALSYQWYSNTSNSSTGGTAISGATSASYTISTNLTAGTYYYFCEVSVAGATSVRSNVATVNVYGITINTQPTATTNVAPGSISGSLSVAATVTPSATLSYQWYSNTTNSSTGGTAISGATSTSYTIPTTLTIGTYYYFCEVSATGAMAVRSSVARVNVAPVITINTQPTATTGVFHGSISGSLSVSATVTPSTTLNYQWYSNTSNSSIGGTAISGATSASYTIPTNLMDGAYYYFCEVSAVGATSVRSNVAMVVVSVPITYEMVWIPDGSFELGRNLGTGGGWDETPVSTVTLTGFHMGIYQVTQAQYQAVMGTTPSWFSSSNSNPPVFPFWFSSNLADEEVQGRRPVEMVSWYDAIVFCNRLSIQEGLTPAYSMSGSTNPDNWGSVPEWEMDAGWDAVTIVSGSTGYRLPTEAQWEYAAKGGNGSPGNFTYSGSNDPDAVGWYSANSNWITHEVGLKQANGLGLYDMSGNVWEWCWDRWGDYTSDAKTDPMGAVSGTGRVIRGGGWDYDASGMRSALRDYYYPSYGSSNVGFRLVRP